MKKDKKQARAENAVIELLKHHKKTGLGFKAILHSLNIAKINRNSLRVILNQLISKNLVTRKGKGYRLSSTVSKEELNPGEEGFIEGKLSMHKSRCLILSHESSKDPIRIYPENVRGALPGDTVRIKITQKRANGRVLGKVLKILAREGVQFVFQVQEDGMMSRTDFDLPVHIDVPEGLKVKSFHRARVLPEINSKHLKAEYLGPVQNNVDVDIEDLVGQYQVPHQFSSAVLNSIQETPKEITDRLDLRELHTFTIDGEDSKDFDDAISIVKDEKSWILYVHIADVTHYVRPKTKVDDEASLRSTSIYFPQYVIPMLPEKLSNDLCSLNPDVDRHSFSCEMHFNSSGRLTKAFAYPSKIRSNRRFTYTNFQSAYDKQNDQELQKEINLCYELFEKLLKHRKKRGAIDFDLPEPVLKLDDKFKVLEVNTYPRLDSHRLIEEFMVKTNVTIAQFSHTAQLPSLYRHHPGPKNDSIANLKDLVCSMGQNFPDLDYKKPESYQTLLAGLDEQFKDVLQPMVIRTMQQAVYSHEHPDHFGLALEYYSHFTSPIRRYPDLIVHRQLKRLIQVSSAKLPLQIYPFQKPKFAPKQVHLSELEKLAKNCSQAERRAVDMERDYHKRKMVDFMSRRLNQTFLARVTGVSKRGLFCELVEYYAEGFLALSQIPGQWQTDEIKQRAVNRYNKNQTLQLGDVFQVRTKRVNSERFEIDFSITEAAVREVQQNRKMLTSENPKDRKPRRNSRVRRQEKQ